MDLTRSSRRQRRTGLIRSLAWLFASGLLTVAALAPASVSAAGPGNNGLDPTGNGTTSNATVGGSLAAAGSSATLDQNAEMFCTGTNVGHIDGQLTLTKTLDVGSKLTLYMVPNNGSNATPVANVTKNEGTITLGAGNHTIGDVIDWSISVTSPFTVSAGGVLVVFAVNADNTTSISSSKTNSLNCTESASTPPSTPPSTEPSAPPSTPPSTEPSTPPSTPPSSEPSTPPSTPPSGSELPAAGSPGPTGEVEGVTATPPPTDTLASASPRTDGLRPVLVGIAALLISVLLMTIPRSARRKE
jgi:hypothetical protein